jgi:hypothetical protein
MTWQVAAWIALWGFWVLISGRNHPNLLINAVATALLVTTFAAAVYANHLWLIPRYSRNGRVGAYATALVVVMTSLALACAAAIRLVYDALWGPDPLRFGFWANFGMELAGVAIHVIAVAVGVWTFGRIARGRGRMEPTSEPGL